MDIKTTEIENWLEESKNDTTNNLMKEPDVDDICQPVNKLNTQTLDLSAESAALTDVMYFLDRGMYMNQIDCTTHLKMIRKLAKRQFLIRAHLIKINQFIVSQQQQQQTQKIN
jgi:ESCRT-I complex subunit TSG101